MRKLVLSVAALALAAPVGAQNVSSAGNPEDDLKCAAWAAVALGLNKDAPETVASLTGAFTWFLAHYEGETGKKFEEGLTAEYITRVGPELPSIEAHCRERMRGVGQRLVDWGQLLQKSGKAQK